jgi:hypothetical protein
MISAAAWEQLAPELEQQVEAAQAAQQFLLREQPALQTEEREDARREGLRAQRAMLAALLRDGVISEAIYEELVTEVDATLEREPEAEGKPARPPAAA